MRPLLLLLCSSSFTSTQRATTPPSGGFLRETACTPVVAVHPSSLQPVNAGWFHPPAAPTVFFFLPPALLAALFVAQDTVSKQIADKVQCTGTKPTPAQIKTELQSAAGGMLG